MRAILLLAGIAVLLVAGCGGESDKSADEGSTWSVVVADNISGGLGESIRCTPKLKELLRKANEIAVAGEGPVGCARAAYADKLPSNPAAVGAEGFVKAADLLNCLSNQGLAVRGAGWFAGGSDETTITGETIDIGPKADPKAVAIVVSLKEARHLATDPSVQASIGEKVGPNVFLTTPTINRKSSQYTGLRPPPAPREIRDLVTACIA